MCGVREFVNKSAASAASLDYVKFQAVIKSAASAASPKAKSREGSSRGAPRAVVRIRSVARPRPSSHLAPSPGAPFPSFCLWGGCASSRLDHGLKIGGIRGGCASSRLISEFSDCEDRAEERFFVHPHRPKPTLLSFPGRG